MDISNKQHSDTTSVSQPTKAQQQAKKEKLARALRDNLRRRKIPAQAKGSEE